MAKNEELNAALSIEELKAKYGKLYQLNVPMEDDTEEVLILRKLDRKSYDIGSKLLEKNELQASEFFLTTLTVKGDAKKVVADFDALRAASMLLIDIIGVKQGNIVTL